MTEDVMNQIPLNDIIESVLAGYDDAEDDIEIDDESDETSETQTQQQSQLVLDDETSGSDLDDLFD